jgi:hypothetical protein
LASLGEVKGASACPVVRFFRHGVGARRWPTGQASAAFAPSPATRRRPSAPPSCAFSACLLRRARSQPLAAIARDLESKGASVRKGYAHRCDRDLRGQQGRKGGGLGQAPHASACAMARACQGKIKGPSRGYRRQRQTLSATANRLSKAAKHACNADLQNRPSAKPVTPTPSHRSTGDLQSATILKCLPNHTRRSRPSCPTKCHPRAQVSLRGKHFGAIVGLRNAPLAGVARYEAGI